MSNMTKINISVPQKEVKVNAGNSNLILEAALAYANIGWYVFPIHTCLFDEKGDLQGCSCEEYRRTSDTSFRRLGPTDKCEAPGKHPRVNWTEKSTTDKKIITGWFSRGWRSINVETGEITYEIPNIGIDCGKSGLLVFDADTYKNVGDLFDLLSKEDMETVTALTGGGGQHLVYKLGNKAYGNSTKNLPVGIDIRGVGGYIVASSSIHKSGNVYQWETGYSPFEIEPIDIPVALDEILSAAHQEYNSNVVSVDDQDKSIQLVNKVLDILDIATDGPMNYGKDSYKWLFYYCPFNDSDNPHAEDKASFVIVNGDGSIAAGCSHNRCNQTIEESELSGWHLLRKKAGLDLKQSTDLEYLPSIVDKMRAKRETDKNKTEPKDVLGNGAKEEVKDTPVLTGDTFNVTISNIDEIVDYLVDKGIPFVEVICKRLVDNTVFNKDEVSAMNLEQIARHWKDLEKKILAKIERSNLMIKLTEERAESTPTWLAIDLDNLDSITPDFVINQFLAKGENGICVGDSNVGKSFWMLHVGLCASLGLSPFSGIEITKPQTVVYACGEGMSRLKRRVAGMISEMGYKRLPDNFHIYGLGTELNLYTGEGVQKIIGDMLESGIEPDLLLFDNFRTLSAGANENAQQDVAIVLDTIAMIGNHLNSATLMVHHNNKQGEYSGSTHFKGRVDVMLTYKLVEDGTGLDDYPQFIKVECDKVRDGKRFPTHAYIIKDNDIGPYVVEYFISDRDDGKNGATVMDKCFNVLKENSSEERWYTVKEVAEMLDYDTDNRTQTDAVGRELSKLIKKLPVDRMARVERQENSKPYRYRYNQDYVSDTF